MFERNHLLINITITSRDHQLYKKKMNHSRFHKQKENKKYKRKTNFLFFFLFFLGSRQSFPFSFLTQRQPILSFCSRQLPPFLSLFSLFCLSSLISLAFLISFLPTLNKSSTWPFIAEGREPSCGYGQQTIWSSMGHGVLKVVA